MSTELITTLCVIGVICIIGSIMSYSKSLVVYRNMSDTLFTGAIFCIPAIVAAPAGMGFYAFPTKLFVLVSGLCSIYVCIYTFFDNDKSLIKTPIALITKMVFSLMLAIGVLFLIWRLIEGNKRKSETGGWVEKEGTDFLVYYLALMGFAGAMMISLTRDKKFGFLKIKGPALVDDIFLPATTAIKEIKSKNGEDKKAA